MKARIGIILCVALLWGCANTIAPTGGPKDETPPSIVQEDSSPNLSTNFDQRGFVLVFDEWIKLNKIHQELIVSPPLSQKPEIKSKGKKVEFEFHEDEELLENTTYVVQFGESVVDLAEGNPASDLKFVFSTGNIIDSLTLSGKVTDVTTNEGHEGLRVMLYDQLHDTVPLTTRPTYVSKTVADGRFAFSNLRSDTFRLVAIEDANSNYIVDPDKEATAFLDTLIYLDQNMSGINMISFTPRKKPLLIKKELQKDRCILGFDGQISPDDLKLDVSNIRLTEWLSDSIILWLEAPVDSFIFYQSFNERTDTHTVTLARKLRRDTAYVEINSKLIKGKVLKPEDSLTLSVSRSIRSVDTSLIELLDTLTNFQFDILADNKRQLKISSVWERERPYLLRFLPGAITSVNGRSLKDTVSISFSVPALEDLGNMIFDVDSNRLSIPIVCTLYRKNNTLFSFQIPEGVKTDPFSFYSLPPDNYELEIVYDENKNGRWDTGDFVKGRQPEIKVRKKLEPLRKNWDLRVNVEL